MTRIRLKGCKLSFHCLTGTTYTQRITATAGNVAGSNGAFSKNALNLHGGQRIKFRLVIDDGVIDKYAVIGGEGQDIFGSGAPHRYEPNKWYIESVKQAFADLERVSFGCYANTTYVIGNGTGTFEMIVED